jgi:hypothetical protein
MRTILFVLALLGATVGRGQIVLDWYTMPIVGGCFPVWDKTPYTSGDISTFMSCLAANFNQTQTVSSTLVGATLSGSAKWSGGVLAPNGKIYGIPRNATQVLEFDPATNTSTLVGATLTGTNKWIGGVLAPNGKIYGIPFSATQVLEFDPVAGTSTLVGATLSGGGKWSGGVLAPNGKIYGILFNATQVLEILNAPANTPDINAVLSRHLNKY